MKIFEQTSLGVNTAIVRILKEYYPRKIPIDFLAKAVGRQTSEIKDYLKNLEHEGIVKLEDDTVSIAEEG